MAEYLPFDSRSNARALLDIIAPAALMYVKLDVWPNLTVTAKQLGVRTGLLSATVAPKSGRQSGVAQLLLRDAYRALDIVGAIDAEDAARLLAIGVRENVLSISGDTRFDQVWKRAQLVQRDGELLTALASERITLVAGSTWPADEKVLLPAWLAVRQQLPKSRFIIAPHEPTPGHVQPLIDWAAHCNLSCKLFSSLQIANASSSTVSLVTQSHLAETDVIIIDRVGVLGDLYALSDVAFVGGAFHSAGLHSVLEPASYGVPVLFGPQFDMSRDAKLLLHHGGALSVNSVQVLTDALIAWLAEPAARTSAGAKAASVVQSGLGAAKRSAELTISALSLTI